MVKMGSDPASNQGTMTVSSHPQQQQQQQQQQSRIASEDIRTMRQRVDAQLANLLPPQQAQEVITPSVDTASSTSTNTASVLLDEVTKFEDDRRNNGKHWVIDPYGDQGNFQGDLDSSGVPHGKGKMSYSDGRIYEGDWKDGKWHGCGKAIFSNQDQYEGGYQDDQRHGQGTYRWNDGRIYTGGFDNDQRHGKGLYTWPDGAKYEGAFAKGLRHGYGEYTFRDKSVYKGEWHRGKYHGKGECRWVDGRVYIGEWENGKAHGQGVETRPDGSIRHDGQWENDRPLRTNLTSARHTDKEGALPVKEASQTSQIESV